MMVGSGRSCAICSSKVSSVGIVSFMGEWLSVIELSSLIVVKVRVGVSVLV